MSGELTLRAATQGDTDEIVQLIQQNMGGGSIPFDQRLWRWKHQLNPFGPSPVILAEVAGQIVSMRAFMRWNWRFGEEKLLSVRAVDTVTHAEYRGRGLFRRLTTTLRDKVRDNGIHVIFNTPNSHSRPGYLKMGWRKAGRPTLWFSPVRPLKLLRALRRRELRADEGEAPPIEADTVASVLEGEAAKAIVAITNSVPNRYTTVPTEEYLSWRYTEIPIFHYCAASMGDAEEGVLIVMRSRKRGCIRELRLCEIILGPRPRALRNARYLLRRIHRLADVDLVVAMAPSIGRAVDLLGASGFTPVPRMGPVITSYPLNVRPCWPDPCRVRSWRPSVGALELF